MTNRDGHNQSDTQDDLIEHALVALGHPPVPEGMQSRLHMAMQTRRDTVSPQRWTMRFPATLAAACLCGLAVVAGVLIHQNHADHGHIAVRADRTKPSVSSAFKAPNQPSSPVYATRHSNAVSISPAEPLISEAVRSREPEQMAEFDHPAPPLPPTEQEKLLLRIAHRGDPVEMAALDDATTRNIDFEAQKTQFNDFFYIHPTETTNEDQ